MDGPLKVKWSFKKELLVSFLILGLLPLLLSNSFLIQVFEAALERSEEKSAQEQLQTMETGLLECFGELESAAQGIGGDAQIREGISATNRWKQNRIYTRLYGMTEGLRDYAQFCIYDGDGICRYSTGERISDAQMPVYWGLLKTAGAHAGEFVMQRAAGYDAAEEICLQAAVAVCDEELNCLGYVVLNIREENLERIFDSVYDKHVEIALLDSFWEEIYGAGSAKGTPLSELLRERILSGEALNQKGDRIHYFVREVGGTQLYLAMGRQNLFTGEMVGQMLAILAIITAMGFILCLIGAEILSNNLSKPVRTLSRAMDTVQNGNLEISLATERNDELGELTQDFNHMTAQLKEYMELQVRQQQELNDANIAMMQAQLNPHFLYNTLDTMKWVAKANHVPELATLASGLARILRQAISAERFIPLSEELRFVEGYIEIQRVRFGERFCMDIEIPMELEDCLVPKMMIQPIVENAVVHGLGECEEGHIFLNIYEKRETLFIEVSDDGCGMEPELIELLNGRDRERLRGHLGFCNVDTMLRLHYGEAYGLKAENLSFGGTKITITLPVRRSEQETGEEKGC